jgi:hypothetical protein
VRRSSGILVAVLAVGLGSGAAHGTTQLAVDLSSTVRPVTHVASGSLYGVLETQPADVTALIAPLHPNVFNNPAADVQQPIGDAIVVAGRLAPIGARVSIRLADWFPSWPYAFTNMTDWLNKVGQTASRRKTANLTNIYAYEIWNEPDGTWKSQSVAFNDMWRQTYAQLKQLEPDIKITGPSISYFNQSYLQSFLSYCKTNSCLPDIVGWHELSGGNLTGNIQAYRNLETQLGIGPLPITINEYSGGADLTVEGQPGASAPLIAKFERLGVDSACISFWDVAHPGRLGSLLASNTDPNGGWWFYKWYGDMAGNMVATTPPTPSSASALDGFANLDSAGQKASVLFGGANDGSVQVTIKGLQAAPFFGSTVHVVVEHTPFVNRTTVVKATDTVSSADVAVTGSQIAVSVPGTNGTDGYRVTLTPVSSGAGGRGGTGGAGGGMSAGGTGGTGAGGAGGMSAGGRGGMGAAGRGGMGGGGRGGGGGATVASGGTSGSGTGGTAGDTGSGGQGVSSTGGQSGSGGSMEKPPVTDMSGCSCHAAGGGSAEGWWSAFVASLLALGRCAASRRRRSIASHK